MATLTQKQVQTAMAEWRDYRGLHPLGNASSGHAQDRCSGLLSNATCILSMLTVACEDAAVLTGKGENSEFSNRSMTVMAGALDGIADLIGLASFLLED
jgi:hypothetical protein